jgi:3-deoxy-7-phosphoheptulonate synthase
MDRLKQSTSDRSYKFERAGPGTPGTLVRIGELAVGGEEIVVIAGPCAVETHEQMQATAEVVKRCGAHALRGGAYKPRTDPYSFQGLGRDGLEMLRRAGDSFGLSVVTELLDTADAESVAASADALQIGARNMQNFALLRAVGRLRRPVILKRGPAARVEELLLAAEYILAEGNDQVILCERGIRSFDTATRNCLDLSVVPYLKRRTHLPIIVDPSHGTGVRELVAPMAQAAIACGADGLLIEVHIEPSTALSDGEQALYPGQFEALMSNLRRVAEAVGRRVG